MNTVWKTIDGEEILIKDLKRDHVSNIIKMIDEHAKNGVEVFYGSGFEGDCARDIYVDFNIIQGKQVQNRYPYKELKARKKELDIAYKQFKKDFFIS